MSIEALSTLSCDHIADLVASDYEFNRFNKNALRGIVSVVTLRVTAEAYSNWTGSESLVYSAISERLALRGTSAHCLIFAPCWQENTASVRYKGMRGSLRHRVEAEHLNFILENEVVLDDLILFYGVVELNRENAKGLFCEISQNENGVLFLSNGPSDPNFSAIVRQLTELVGKRRKSTTFYLDIVAATNAILSSGSEVIFPYAFEETGTYHLDILSKSAALSQQDQRNRQ